MSEECRRDIIKGLAERALHHVIEKILSHLDYESLAQAELVSREWLEASSRVRTWQKLLQKNTTMLPIWKKVLAVIRAISQSKNKEITPIHEQSSITSLKTLSCQIGDKLKILQNNWDTFQFVLLTKKCRRWVSPDLHTDLGGQWIACVDDESEEPDDDSDEEERFQDKISLYYRWVPGNLQRKKVLKIPLKGRENSLLNLRLNDKFVVASMFDSPEIFVWDGITTELLFVLNREESRWKGSGLSNLICLSETYLFSYATKYHEPKPPNVVTIWKMPSVEGSEAEKVCRVALPSSSYSQLDAAEMDDSFIVLFISGQSREIEVRKTISFEMVTTIHTDKYDRFHYRHGLIATGKHKNKIKIWDASTGRCVGNILYEATLLNLHVLSKNKVISCNNFGELKIWDLQGALQHATQPNPGVLLKTFTVVSQEHRLNIRRAIVKSDEFQIVLSIKLDDNMTAHLYVLDFLRSERKKQLAEKE